MPVRLLLVLLAAAVAAERAAAEEDAQAEGEAAALFERGVALYQEGDWTGALAAFEAAYERSPLYAVLFNIGVCRKLVQDVPGAVDALERYLREGGDGVPPERRTEVETMLEELRPLLASVAVRVDVDGAEVWVDERPGGTSPLPRPLILGPGEHVIRVRAPDGREAESRGRLAGGESIVVELRLAEEGGEAPAERLSPAWFWSAVGAAGALAAAGAFTGAMTLVEEDAFDDAATRCAGGDRGACSEGRDAAARYEDYQLATNVLFPAAGVFAAAALALAFFTDFAGTESPPPAFAAVPLAGGVGLSAAVVF